MRVFLDDVRRHPPGWVKVSTAQSAIKLLETGDVYELSLDHDLWNSEEVDERTGTLIPHGSGFDVAAWLYEQAYQGNWACVPKHIRIHSASVRGVSIMAWLLANVERLRRRLVTGETTKPKPLKVVLQEFVMDAQMPDPE